jgi:hypothetical protein
LNHVLNNYIYCLLLTGLGTNGLDYYEDIIKRIQILDEQSALFYQILVDNSTGIILPYKDIYKLYVKILFIISSYFTKF